MLETLRATEQIQKLRKKIFLGSRSRSKRDRNGNQISKPRRYSFKMFKFEINVVVGLPSKIIIRERKI